MAVLQGQGSVRIGYNALQYIASYSDLLDAFGIDGNAGVNHYNVSGYAEGRQQLFGGLAYIASHADLIAAFGADAEAGARHFILSGHVEGRLTTFRPYEYLASYTDLIAAFGDDQDGAARHYIAYGFNERRTVTFDAQAYLNANADVKAVFGSDLEAAARHFLDFGRLEGRVPFYVGVPPTGGTASTPTLALQAAFGDEDTGIALSIAAGTTGSGETLTVTVTVPAGATLSAGHDNGDGTWTLSGAQLSGLVFTPPHDASGTFNLAVAATAQTASGATATATSTLAVTVAPVTDQPHLIAPFAAAGNEDAAIPLVISFTSPDLDGSETLSVTIGGVPSGATLSAGTDNHNGSWTVSAAQLLGLTITPPADSSDGFALTVTGTAKDGSAASVTTGTVTVPVSVTAVSDAPKLVVTDVPSVAFGASIALNAGQTTHVALTPADPSETLGAVQIVVPSAFTLNHGLLTDEGFWVISDLDQLADLTMIPVDPLDPLVYDTFNVQVTASSVDGSAAAASVTKTLAVTVAPPPDLLVSQVVDGYIAGATVFSDANGNGLLDAGELSTRTGADGSFTLVGADASKPLVMFGGTDISTGLAFTGKLTAVGGSTVITPLTTLVQALVASRAAVDATTAQNQVKTALGISSSVDLSTFDPVDATAKGIPAGAAVLAAGIQVQATVTQLVAAATQSQDAVSTTTVLASLASAISTAASQPQPVVLALGSPDTIRSLATSAGLSQDAAAGVSSVTAAANASIADAASAVASDTTAVLTNVAKAATTAINTTTTAISQTNFSDGGQTQSLQTGFVTNLDGKVQTAAVAVVVPPVVGTIGNDTLDQSAAATPVVIDAQDGNDVLIGGTGNDQLFGGRGLDVLTGKGGNNLLDGGAGFDRAVYLDAGGPIVADLAAGTVTRGSAIDTLVSVESIRGTSGADAFTAAGYTATTHLSAGQTVNDKDNFNEFEGGGGNDTITGNGNTRASYAGAAAAVTVNLGTGGTGSAPGDVAGVGSDTFVSGVNQVRGSAFDDVLSGTNTYGKHVSAQYVEIFEGLAGNDTIDGGSGFDRARYDNFPTGATGITVNMAQGTVTGRDAAATAVVGTDRLISIESVFGTNADDVYDATGYTAFSNLSAGQVVNDQGSFNEFEGGGGNDTITGNGNTRINYLRANDGVTVDLTTGIARGTAANDLAGIGTDTLSGVNAVRGTQFADILRGTSTNGSNTESFDGRGGDDVISGGKGFDQIRYDGEAVGPVGITVNLVDGTVTSTDATTLAVVGRDRFTSIESVVGTYSDDTYIATGYTATSNLLPVTDTVLGQATNDQRDFNEFQPLGGNDTITGNGNTRISYQRAEDGITVTFSAAGAGTVTSTNANDTAHVGTDTFTGVNSVRGSIYNDTFTGSSANDIFDGLAGDDAIDGAGGIDQVRYDGVLTGSVGIQVNMAAGSVSSTDAVTAFGVGTDTLRRVESIRGTNAADTYDATGFGGASVNAGSNGAYNLFEGKGGNDSIIGNGATTISFATASAVGNTLGVTVDFRDGTAYGTDPTDAAVVGRDTFSGVNGVAGSTWDDHVFVTGGGPALTLGLDTGTDTVTLAGSGSPAYVLTLTGVEKIDALGGANDQLTLAAVPSGTGTALAIDTGDGIDVVSLGAGATSTWSLGLSNVETLNTSTGNTGSQTVNLSKAVSGITVDLGAGNDTLILYGPDSTASNSLTVANVETINGLGANNTITLDGSGGGLNQNLYFGSGHNVVNLGGIDNNTAGGNSIFRFSFTGTDVAVNGRAGNDDLTITSTIYNNKVIDLGDGTDALHLTGIAGQLTVVTVKNIETVYGSSQAEQITIAASTNETTVIAGGGADSITASAGVDHFKFTAQSDSFKASSTVQSDLITGFTAGSDSFDFAASIGLAGNAIDFIGTRPNDVTAPSASGHAQAYLTQGGGVLHVDVNNDGTFDSTHDMEIRLVNLQGTLASSDFHIV